MFGQPFCRKNQGFDIKEFKDIGGEQYLDPGFKTILWFRVPKEKLERHPGQHRDGEGHGGGGAGQGFAPQGAAQGNNSGRGTALEKEGQFILTIGGQGPDFGDTVGQTLQAHPLISRESAAAAMDIIVEQYLITRVFGGLVVNEELLFADGHLLAQVKKAEVVMAEGGPQGQSQAGQVAVTQSAFEMADQLQVALLGQAVKGSRGGVLLLHTCEINIGALVGIFAAPGHMGGKGQAGRVAAFPAILGRDLLEDLVGIHGLNNHPEGGVALEGHEDPVAHIL